jgi:hypothetical protein
MGIQINVGDHTSSQAGYVAVPNNLRGMTRWARTRAKTIARDMPSADVYFRRLPNGKSLTELLADSSIWINYSPSLTDFGQTNFAGGKEIAIGPGAYRIGRWTVLATLIHELAHVDGVRGRLTPRVAEDALLACGLGRRSERTTGVDDARTPYDPNIRG